MPDSLHDQIRTYLHRLEHLSWEGQSVRDRLAEGPADAAALALMREWQRECGATVGQLSGGSKAHWLSRAYSEAFLPAPTDTGTSGAGRGGPREAGPGEGPRISKDLAPSAIVERVLNVLGQAATSLIEMARDGSPPPASPAVGSRRFEFVRDAQLRPSLEQALLDAEAALSDGRNALALVNACSIIEAVLTDALEGVPDDSLATHRPSAAPIPSWSFEARIAAAEGLKLISGGCARLSPAARQYHALLGADGEIRADADVSVRDAQVSLQVLRVLMRDRAPGR